jgi:hypothetical protein
VPAVAEVTVAVKMTPEPAFAFAVEDVNTTELPAFATVKDDALVELEAKFASPP